MRLILISAALLAGAIATPSLAKPVPEEASEASSKLKPSDFDMSKLMGMFDKMFPAPSPIPRRSGWRWRGPPRRACYPMAPTPACSTNSPAG
jgi:hypothetical protein